MHCRHHERACAVVYCTWTVYGLQWSTKMNKVNKTFSSVHAYFTDVNEEVISLIIEVNIQWVGCGTHQTGTLAVLINNKDPLHCKLIQKSLKLFSDSRFCHWISWSNSNAKTNGYYDNFVHRTHYNIYHGKDSHQLHIPWRDSMACLYEPHK